MNSLDLIRKNKDRLARKTANYLKDQLKYTERDNTGIYQGYIGNQHQVKLTDGSIINGDLISNGAVAVGAKVVVSIPISGKPLIKSVSH